MEEKLIKTKHIIGEEGVNYHLEYYLLHHKHSLDENSLDYLRYGVEIKMKKEDRDSYCECESSEEIFASEKSALEFIEIISTAAVTPCTLHDIVIDTLIEAL